MSIQVSPNLPANVVEIGNEVTQAKVDEINAGTLATQDWVTGQGYSTTSGISDAPIDGAIYARQNGGWTAFTPSSYNANLAIANLCASCFLMSSNFGFTNYVAACVAQGSKFQMGSQYLLGIGIPGSAPTYAFNLSYSSSTFADTGISATSVSGHCICYSDNYGSSWTYSDLTF
jgi:hypothetical protein